MTMKWQYKVIDGVEENEIGRKKEDMLNALGNDGWELVSVTLISDYVKDGKEVLTDSEWFTYFFKRQLPPHKDVIDIINELK